MNEKTKTTLENLNRHGFISVFFDSKEEALDYVLKHVGGEDIGMGGSETLSELGWYDPLSKRGKVHWHAKTPEDKDTFARAGNAPCYMLSANAISMDGKIVNIDARGNRVAAAAYGGKKTFYICGENKISENMQEALMRAKNIAAPLNAKRLNRKTPCAIKADKCYNCNSPERICRTTSITSIPPAGMEVHVLFISGNWGY